MNQLDLVYEGDEININGDIYSVLDIHEGTDSYQLTVKVSD